MDGLRPVMRSTAPRLYLRRMTRAYFFPWVQLGCTTLLALFAWYIRIPGRPILIWWAATLGLVVLQDLAGPWSRLTKIYHRLRRRLTPALPTMQNQVFFLYPASPLVHKSSQLNWLLPLLLLLVTWAFAYFVSRLQTTFPAAQATLIEFTLLVGLIPYAMLIDAPLGYSTRPIRYFIWAAIGLAGLFFAFFSFYPLTGDRLFTLLSSGIIVILYTFVFVSRRLWAAERILNEVIHDISLELLSWPHASGKLDKLPELIGARLKHDRVFILQTEDNNEVLKIHAAYGDRSHLQGQTVPIKGSITGRALREKVPVAWNDVSACPYYHGFPPDDTGAEIAVPIIHDGIVYGILDVQTRRKDMYGPKDVDALETIAQMLGTAIAIDKRDHYFEEAVQLWEKVGVATQATFAKEEDVFALFAGFARDTLGADLVIYFPLSLAGCPVEAPLWRGELYRPDLLRPPRNDSTSSLVKLIKRWQPYYEMEVTTDSLVAQSTMSGVPSFVQREGIRSTCFIPVGMPQERLAGLFLNFRKPKKFDSLFQFTVLSLAQSLAKMTAKIRYRQILFESFGRPELNIHSILNRLNLKSGVMLQAETLWRHCGPACCSSLSACKLHDLFSNMDEFLHEIYMAESSIPPSFWSKELREELRKHKTTLPAPANGQQLRVHLAIDPGIERESPWLKLALYRVITEALNNAVSHGEATTIDVKVRRGNAQIEVMVCNDGHPLPEGAQYKRSNNGIFVLLEEFEEKLGARSHIACGSGGVGTVVHIVHPALPLNEFKEEK